MTSLESFWAGIEAAAPDNPAPLLVCADWCDENREPGLAYVLRWCAGHGKRPQRRTGVVRWAWRWIRQQTRYPAGSVGKRALRKAEFAVVSPHLFAASRHDNWSADFKSSLDAYRWLAAGLSDLRGVVEVPDIVLPPHPSVTATGPVTCAACGLVRDRDVLACPVCKSAEVR